jgi:hypothetical protein
MFSERRFVGRTGSVFVRYSVADNDVPGDSGLHSGRKTAVAKYVCMYVCMYVYIYMSVDAFGPVAVPRPVPILTSDLSSWRSIAKGNFRTETEVRGQRSEVSCRPAPRALDEGEPL